MRRMVLAAMAAAILLSAADAVAASGIEAGIRGAYWFPKMSGDVRTTTNGVPDTRFDVKDTLGMQDENFPFGEAYVRFGRVVLRVGYSQLKFDGDKTLTETITFNGQTFGISDNVVSKLDLKMLDGDFQFDLLRPDLGAMNLNLGLIVKVKYVDGSVELRSALEPDTKKDFKAAVPMVGLAVGAGALREMVRVDARGTGIAWAGNHLYDADAYASFSPVPFLRIQGGYRYIDLKIDYDDTLASFKLKGPYVGGQLSF